MLEAKFGRNPLYMLYRSEEVISAHFYLHMVKNTTNFILLFPYIPFYGLKILQINSYMHFFVNYNKASTNGL